MIELLLPLHIPESGVWLYKEIEILENHLIDQALERTRGNKNAAAKLLGMNRTTLVEKLRKRGLIIPAKKRE